MHIKTNRVPAYAIIFSLMILSAFLPPLSVFACDEACFKELLKQNEELATLNEFKESEQTLRAKIRHLDYINEFRKQAGVQEVGYDLLAGRVADMQAKNAAVNDFWGHYDMNGYTPYLRFGLNGGREHVSENAYEKTSRITHYKGKPECSMEDADKMLADMKEATDDFMNEGPGGKHHDTIINGDHNFVGIGYYCEQVLKDDNAEFRVRYYDEFINRYIIFDELKDKIAPDEKVVISGSVIPEDTGIYMVAAYYVEPPNPMAPSEINEQPPFYKDYTEDRYMLLPPWELVFDTSKRRFTVEFKADRKGFYYIQTLIKKGIDSIPYDPKAKNKKISSDDTIPASGIVLLVE